MFVALLVVQALLEKKKQELQEKRGDTRKKPKKHNIKRPLTAYMRFSVGRRKEIVEKDPEMRHPSRFKEIAQRISQEWRDLDAKRKREIEKEAATDLAKYKQKVHEWKMKHVPKRKKKTKKQTRTPTDTPPTAPAAAAPAGGVEGCGGGRDKAERTREQPEREKATEAEADSEAPEAANAATDVPESSDEISNNSRQSSAPETLGGDTNQDNKRNETLAATGAVAEAPSATTTVA